MSKEIVISSSVQEVRVAIIEDGRLSEYFIESPENTNIVGNIYLGRVTNVVPGLNAAFINIGFKQDAFLHFSDIDESLEKTFLLEEDEESAEEEAEGEKTEAPANQRSKKKAGSKDRDDGEIKFYTKSSGAITIDITKGQEVLVQAMREAYSSKGVKVTSRVALAGRYLVLMPSESLLGVSKKIMKFTERKRLRSILRPIVSSDYGCIIRTAAADKSEEELEKDWYALEKKWKEIEAQAAVSSAPQLMHQDLDLGKSILRDLLTSDVMKVTVDSKKLFSEMESYLNTNSPGMLDKLEFYADKSDIFAKYGIERDINSIYKRQINLKSGASIVIDNAEAMTVIDVNSGRAVEKNQEKTALMINMEAMREVARQMRLRDLAGIIVVDFIDMMDENNRKKLYFEMKRELAKDRTKTIIYPITQLGLMQITRQRVNKNISEKLTETCPRCAGSGRVLSKTVLLNQIEKWLKNFRSHSKEFKLVMIVNSDLAEFLTAGTVSRLSKLMFKFFIKIKLEVDDTISNNHFHFFSLKEQTDITKDYN